MLETLLKTLLQIKVRGKEALDFITTDGDPVQFLDMLDVYLRELESWQVENKEYLQAISENTKHVSDHQREEIRAALEEVKQLHSRLMENSKGLMNEVHSELGNINRRAQGIRKYVDILPSRVSVTPKKKG